MACQYSRVPSTCVAIREFFMFAELGFKDRHETGEWSVLLRTYWMSPKVFKLNFYLLKST